MPAGPVPGVPAGVLAPGAAAVGDIPSSADRASATGATSATPEGADAALRTDRAPAPASAGSSA
ncbi:hypothetical protein ACIQ9P_11405 [Kitasatospora sp. NPDC094019]|uniref:hypothetical protein n=1 Tax=Kitasatospora sp. NPDC094019 TaxID=3364091 RepID=UPI0038248F6E